MLKILPIILSRISQKILLLFFLLFLYLAYYSIIILTQYYNYICGLSLSFQDAAISTCSFVRIINSHFMKHSTLHIIFVYP